MSPPRRDVIERFSKRYAAPESETLREIERRVIGGVFGANGYTTKRQADRLVKALRLRRSSRLLDVGSGRGWPGLYLAERSGCEAVLMDVPDKGLEVALRRASGMEAAGRVNAVRASGERIPFARGSFDAVTHTDVL